MWLVSFSGPLISSIHSQYSQHHFISSNMTCIVSDSSSHFFQQICIEPLCAAPLRGVKKGPSEKVIFELESEWYGEASHAAMRVKVRDRTIQAESPESSKSLGWAWAVTEKHYEVPWDWSNIRKECDFHGKHMVLGVEENPSEFGANREESETAD